MDYLDKEIILTITDPEEQLLVIKQLKEWGIKVYDRTTEYDPSYPYLLWDSKELTQCHSVDSKRIQINTVQEFLNIFNPIKEPNYEIY